MPVELPISRSDNSLMMTIAGGAFNSQDDKVSGDWAFSVGGLALQVGIQNGKGPKTHYTINLRGLIDLIAEKDAEFSNAPKLALKKAD